VSARPSIELHVRELVLDGAADVDPRQLRAAFEAELTRLIEAGGGFPGIAALDGLDRLPATQVDVLATDGSAAIGTSLAQSVFRSLGGAPS
jgi:hypothetical protein